MKFRFYCVLVCCALLFSMGLSAYAAGTTKYVVDAPDKPVSVFSDQKNSKGKGNGTENLGTSSQIVKMNATVEGSFTYTDKDKMISFEVPAKLTEKKVSASTEITEAVFVSAFDEEEIMIAYGKVDIWSEMTAAERGNFSRSTVDMSIVTKKDFAAACGLPSYDVELVTYGSNTYFTSIYKPSIPEVRHMTTIKNGYMFMFFYAGTNVDKYFGDFETMLSSVEFHFAETTSASQTGNQQSTQNVYNTYKTPMWDSNSLLLSLILTISIYSLPIIIYRYVVRMEPVDKSKAKKITIIYGIFAFILMSLVLYKITGDGSVGGAIIVWSSINYLMLTRGHSLSPRVSESLHKGAPVPPSKPQAPCGNTAGKEGALVSSADHAAEARKDVPHTEKQEMTLEEAPLPVQQEPVIQQAPLEESEDDILFCYKCGNKLRKGSLFCNKCGTKIKTDDTGR